MNKKIQILRNEIKNNVSFKFTVLYVNIIIELFLNNNTIILL